MAHTISIETYNKLKEQADTIIRAYIDENKISTAPINEVLELYGMGMLTKSECQDQIIYQLMLIS